MRCENEDVSELTGFIELFEVIQPEVIYVLLTFGSQSHLE